MSKEKLKQCYFCNSESIKLIRKVKPNTRGQEHNYYVTCNSCKARGSLKGTETEALNSWNLIESAQEKGLFDV